jgi:diguanylate cyclase (GGDEF)-like protein
VRPDDTILISGSTRTLARVLAGVAVFGLVACVVQATVGLGSAAAEAWFTSYVSPLVYLPIAALFVLRACKLTGARMPWMLIGLAYMSWAAASLGYNVSLGTGHRPAIPSFADAGWLVFYPVMFFAFVAMIRARHVRLSGRAWLDGLIGALALAALISTFLVEPLEAAGAGDPRVVATLLAYPLADVALMWLVLTIGTELGWRLGRDWLLIAAALVMQVSIDVLYAYKTAAGTWEWGTLLETPWMVSGLLIAWAAWHPPSPPRQVAADAHWHSLILPALCTAVALAILAIVDFQSLPVATVLGTATIVMSLIRAATVSQQQRVFRDLARRDPLTGLLNHGAFHAELQANVERWRDSTDPFSVVLFDLDAFKAINDDRGHAEGDRVLREVAAAVAEALREQDVCARVGGDEFAALLRGADAVTATTIAQRARQIVRERAIGVDLSFGIGTWPVDGPSKSLLLLRADTALYAAKPKVHSKRQLDDELTGALLRHSPSDAERDAYELHQREQLRAYAEEVRTSHTRELQRSQELKDSYLATVRTLAAAVEAKDDYTGCHIQRVHGLGLLLAQTVIPQQASDPQLSYGLLLHDIGKLAVPDAVLTKRGKLDEHEWQLMKQHPEQGAKILAGIPFLDRALDIVRHHHERWDGSGYPDGLHGEQIPLWARMFAIVDTVDAITSDRPYRAARPLNVALAELVEGSGSQFDPACVQAFLRIDRHLIELLLEQRGTSIPRISDLVLPEFSFSRSAS